MNRVHKAGRGTEHGCIFSVYDNPETNPIPQILGEREHCKELNRVDN